MDFSDVGAALKRVPWWGWAAGGGAGLAGVYYIRKHGQASAASQVGTPPAGLNASDLAGLPFDYQDYQAANNNDPSQNPGDTSGTPASFGYDASSAGYLMGPIPPAPAPGSSYAPYGAPIPPQAPPPPVSPPPPHAPPPPVAPPPPGASASSQLRRLPPVPPATHGAGSGYDDDAGWSLGSVGLGA